MEKNIASGSGARSLAQTLEEADAWRAIRNNALAVTSVEELKAVHPRPIAARVISDSVDYAGLRDLLLEEDNTLEHLFLEEVSYPGEYPEGFLEAAVSKLSSLGVVDSLALAKTKMQTVKLRTLIIREKEEQVIGALSKPELWKHLERLEVVSWRNTYPAVFKLAWVLEDPDCKIWDLILRVCNDGVEYIDKLMGTVERTILSVLEGNYSSRIQRLQICDMRSFVLAEETTWESKVLEERWLRLQHRNALFATSPVLKERRPMRPSSRKLFMCGHTGSGKTTISKNLVRSRSSRWQQCMPVTNQNQNQASTVGIEQRRLRFGKNKKVIIYDLGGQEVYHAFHHYFIRGSDKDIFVVVCKVDGNQSPGEFERLLRYWLRFIVAHQSAAPARKPKVLILLNIFIGVGARNQSIVINAQATAGQVSTDYSDKLDCIVSPRGDRYFEVNGLDAHQVQALLKPSIKMALADMLHKTPDIPWTCDTVIRSRTASSRWYKSPIAKERVVHVDKLSKSLFKGQFVAAEYTFMCLHDMGEAVYFGAEEGLRNRNHVADEETALLVNYAVLDMPWFLHKVLGAFIPPQDREDMNKLGDPNWTIEQAIQHLKSTGEENLNNICFLLKLLHTMGILIPDDTNWQNKWSNPPKQLIVPALLPTKIPAWIKDEEKYHCWGRRLQPEEKIKDFVLLPSGVFAVIQSQVKKLCDALDNQSHLGDGWISFQEDLIQVLVVVGGEGIHWTERQWVDIMLMSPKEEYRCFKGEKFLNNIKDFVEITTYRACPFVKLEEHILHPNEIRRLGAHETDQSSRLHMKSKPLQRIKELASNREVDSDYNCTWGWNDSTVIWELLMPSELKELYEPRKRTLEQVITEYNQQIVEVYNINSQKLQHMIPDCGSDGMNNLAKFMLEQFQEVRTDFKTSMKDIKVSMEEIKQSVQMLQKGLKDTEDALINSCSSLLRHIKLECPKHPHLTLNSNLFLRYSPLIGKLANIHYLCEQPGNCHPVDIKRYPGVQILVQHSWFKEYGNILVPAITTCFILAKLGKVALPVGKDVAGTLIELAEGGLKTATDSCFGGEINCRLEPASAHDILKLFEYVKKHAPQVYGENRVLMMEECFGLYRNADNNAWVCKGHLKF